MVYTMERVRITQALWWVHCHDGIMIIIICGHRSRLRPTIVPSCNEHSIIHLWMEKDTFHDYISRLTEITSSLHNRTANISLDIYIYKHSFVIYIRRRRNNPHSTIESSTHQRIPSSWMYSFPSRIESTSVATDKGNRKRERERKKMPQVQMQATCCRTSLPEWK